jgi:hypothetical protein
VPSLANKRSLSKGFDVQKRQNSLNQFCRQDTDWILTNNMNIRRRRSASRTSVKNNPNPALCVLLSLVVLGWRCLIRRERWRSCGMEKFILGGSGSTGFSASIYEI